jgi:hypothetical protein
MEYTEKRKRKREEIPHRSFWAVLGVGTLFLWRSLIYKPARWMWRHGLRLTRWTLRSSWRVTVWALQKTWAATKWTVLAPFRLLRWLYNMFIRGIPEPDDPFLAIRWRIKRRFRRRQRFMTHLFAFLGVNFIAAADWLLNSFKYHSYTGRSLLAYGVMMAFWVAVILFHFMRMRLADEEDRTIQAELERQRDYQMPYLVEDEYTLNERYTRLAVSGESSSEMELAPEKRKRR